MAQNYGLLAIWPQLTNDDLSNLQGFVPHAEAPGLALKDKGYNEFTLYGVEMQYFNLNEKMDFYYIYTAMSWSHQNRPVSGQSTAFGVFLQNEVTFGLDGWICEFADQTQYGWLCTGYEIHADEFDPTDMDLPLGRHPTSFWECGCEDRNTYTQAFCRQSLVSESQQNSQRRLRYQKDTNVMMWTVEQTASQLIWTMNGRYQMLSAVSLLTTLATAGSILQLL